MVKNLRAVQETQVQSLGQEDPLVKEMATHCRILAWKVCFLELSCFFNDPADVGNLISGSSAFYKTSLNIWKFAVHVLLKPGLENFEHYFTSMR